MIQSNVLTIIQLHDKHNPYTPLGSEFSNVWLNFLFILKIEIEKSGISYGVPQSAPAIFFVGIWQGTLFSFDRHYKNATTWK